MLPAGDLVASFGVVRTDHDRVAGTGVDEHRVPEVVGDSCGQRSDVQTGSDLLKKALEVAAQMLGDGLDLQYDEAHASDQFTSPETKPSSPSS
jgi:hypothetical protein